MGREPQTVRGARREVSQGLPPSLRIGVDVVVESR